jgi:hypothetical protein
MQSNMIFPDRLLERRHERDQAETVILAPAWEKFSWNLQPVQVTM